MPDFSFIDIDELGMRPRDWDDEGTGIEFDGTGQDYFGLEKPLHFDPYTSDLRSRKSGKQFTVNETNGILSDDDDDDFLSDSQYDIDPETGKQTLLVRHMTSSVYWHNRFRDSPSIFIVSIWFLSLDESKKIGHSFSEQRTRNKNRRPK